MDGDIQLSVRNGLVIVDLGDEGVLEMTPAEARNTAQLYQQSATQAMNVAKEIISLANKIESGM